jgi:hypothetical protein
MWELLAFHPRIPSPKLNVGLPIAIANSTMKLWILHTSMKLRMRLDGFPSVASPPSPNANLI